jgi:D-aminopeptidase
MGKPRARDLGLRFRGTPGKFNAITDVPGVEVGFSTLKSHATNDCPQICTGVTAVLPRGHHPVPLPVWAGRFDLNGNGEMTGSHWVRVLQAIDHDQLLQVMRAFGPSGVVSDRGVDRTDC